MLRPNNYESLCANECGQAVGTKGSHGLCSACSQARRRRIWAESGESRACRVDGCTKRADQYGATLCRMHQARVRKYGDPGSPEGNNRERGTGGRTKSGYIVIQRNGRRIPEHHWVIEESLGRQLHPFENVHHKNGVRHDNRLDNLEIWVVPQPKGQRPEDLLAWCQEHMRELQEAADWNAA